jgi:EmrB/QacA subfamily drug resistance transporter
MQPLSEKTVRMLPYIVAATFFMEYLDTTIISTALPQIAHTFRLDPNAVSLGMTAYMLTLAVFIPISGWVADRCGSRTVFTSAIVTFTVASVLCGASQNLLEFTAARILQGIGGAMMVPVGRLIVVRATDKANLMKAIATITWPAIAAPVIGPPLGGFITTYASWRWIFLLNIPFGIAAFCAARAMVRNDRGDQKRPLDWVGFLLSGGSLTAIMFGTELASRRGTPVAGALAYVVGGIALGVLSFYHARARPQPMIDYSTLRIPTYSVTVVTGALTRIGYGAVPYLLPLLFQIGFGMSAFKSGLLLLCGACGNLGMKAVTSRILRRFGFRSVAVVDVTLGGLFIVGCGFLLPSTPVAIVILVLLAYGTARSMQFTLLSTLAYADMPATQTSAATTLWSAVQQMTLGLGIAFGAVALRVSAYFRPEHLAGATDTSQHYVLADFRLAFIAAGLATFISVLGYARLPRNAGERVAAGGARAGRA